MGVKFEIINRNYRGYKHYLIVPSIELTYESDYYYENKHNELAVAVSWFNWSAWLVISWGL